MRRPRCAAGALLLFALPFTLYFAIGNALAPSRMFGRADLVLGSDVPRVIADLTRFDANHYRTKVHPLFVLLLNPVGSSLKELLGPPRIAAILLNSAFGALGVALFHRLLRLWGVAAPRAALWAALFGLSASQLFFGSIPETYAFSGASLLLLFVMYARGAARGPAFIAAGAFALGMTVTNLAIGVWLRARAFSGAGFWQLVPRLVRYTAVVLGISAGLALLQAWHYPRARLFFGPGAFEEERRYAFVPRSASALAWRAAELAANGFVFNLAAPTLRVEKLGHRYPVTSFAPPAPAGLRPAGAAHAALWLALAGTAVWAARGRLLRQAPLQALLGCLGFQLALHFLYGERLFLYSCHWTFATLGLVALSLEHQLAARPARAGPAAAALVVLLLLQAAANAAFLFELYGIYR